MSIRILIADDHEVVLLGLAALLEGTGIEIVGSADSGREAVQLAKKHRPDVVLLDIRMGNGDGLEALDEIRAVLPDTRVIMLSTFDNPTHMARAAALGACEYLLKGCSREELVTAITAVARGETPLRSAMRQLAGNARIPAEDTEDVSLTQRESQVLRHMALGLSNKEIGKALQISVDTVKEHVQNVLRKIHATDRTQAAVWAVRKNLV